MKHFLAVVACLLSVIIGVPGAWAAGPYIQLEVRVLSRDVVEDVTVVQDSEVVGFKARGEAVSTRTRRSSDSNFPDGFSDKVDLEEDDNFGIFGGVDIFIDRSEKTAINFEVSLFDQDSFRAAIRREF